MTNRVNEEFSPSDVDLESDFGDAPRGVLHEFFATYLADNGYKWKREIDWMPYLLWIVEHERFGRIFLEHIGTLKDELDKLVEEGYLEFRDGDGAWYYTLTDQYIEFYKAYRKQA